jgi:hypothetical protein
MKFMIKKANHSQIVRTIIKQYYNYVVEVTKDHLFFNFNLVDEKMKICNC